MKALSSRYAAFWLGLSVLFRHEQASAQPAPNLHVALEYHVDPTLEACPTSAELGGSIAKQLGYDPFTPDAGQYRLRINLVHAAERIEAQIEWVDPHQNSEGERRLYSESNDCTGLARSLSFAVAVQIQLHASAAPPSLGPPHAETSARDERQAPEKTPRKPAEPRPHPDPPRSDDRFVYAGAGVLLRRGLTPHVSPGARVFGALARSGWSLELSAHATLPDTLRLADGTGFTARELGVSLAPCANLSLVGLCAVGSLGILHVRGEGVDHVASPSSTVGGAGARVQVLWPALERLGILAYAEALAVVTPRDVLLNEARVWSSAPVVVTASLDFAAIFR